MGAGRGGHGAATAHRPRRRRAVRPGVRVGLRDGRGRRGCVARPAAAQVVRAAVGGCRTGLGGGPVVEFDRGSRRRGRGGARTGASGGGRRLLEADDDAGLLLALGLRRPGVGGQVVGGIDLAAVVADDGPRVGAAAGPRGFGVAAARGVHGLRRGVVGRGEVAGDGGARGVGVELVVGVWGEGDLRGGDGRRVVDGHGAGRGKRRRVRVRADGFATGHDARVGLEGSPRGDEGLVRVFDGRGWRGERQMGSRGSSLDGIRRHHGRPRRRVPGRRTDGVVVLEDAAASAHGDALAGGAVGFGVGDGRIKARDQTGGHGGRTRRRGEVILNTRRRVG